MNANISKRLSTACLAALFCCGALTTAVAGEAQTGITVKYGDLNLSNAKGVATLYGRIERAATAVCGASPSPAPLGFKRVREQCRAEAIANAIQAVNIDVLTAMHKEKASRRFG
jgi:UrcA family protein